MPRCLEPGLRLPIVLDWDKDKPADKRPTFYTRAYSMRQSEALGTLLDSIGPNQTSKEYHESLFAILKEIIVGWEHMSNGDGKDIPFDVERLPDILERDEANEIIRKFIAGTRPDADEKKS